MHPVFVIWNFKHQAWWKAGGLGFTPCLLTAGRFTFEEVVNQRLDPVSLDQDTPYGDALLQVDE